MKLIYNVRCDEKCASLTASTNNIKNNLIIRRNKQNKIVKFNLLCLRLRDILMDVFVRQTKRKIVQKKNINYPELF